MVTKRAILIHTSRNEIFFGYSTNELHEEEMLLLEARNIVRYSADNRGMIGLAAVGPRKQCKVSYSVPELYVRNVVWACAVRAEAIAHFEAAIWE